MSPPAIRMMSAAEHGRIPASMHRSSQPFESIPDFTGSARGALAEQASEISCGGKYSASGRRGREGWRAAGRGLTCRLGTALHPAWETNAS